MNIFCQATSDGSSGPMYADTELPDVFHSPTLTNSSCLGYQFNFKGSGGGDGDEAILESVGELPHAARRRNQQQQQSKPVVIQVGLLWLLLLLLLLWLLFPCCFHCFSLFVVHLGCLVANGIVWCMSIGRLFIRNTCRNYNTDRRLLVICS